MTQQWTDEVFLKNREDRAKLMALRNEIVTAAAEIMADKQNYRVTGAPVSDRDGHVSFGISICINDEEVTDGKREAVHKDFLDGVTALSKVQPQHPLVRTEKTIEVISFAGSVVL